MKSFYSQIKTAVFSIIRAYGMSILVFIFGCISFFAMGPGALKLFSVLALIMQICIVYSFANKCAFREVRDDLVGPMGKAKGFVVGAVSMVPFAAIIIIAELFLPTSNDWTVAPDIAGLVQAVIAYGGYFYYGASGSMWLRLTALLVPVVVSGLGYISAINKFDVDEWINIHILKKPAANKDETGYDYFKRTGRKF